MYFWAAVVVVLGLMCFVGWRMDRRHKGNRVIGRAGDSMDARANETIRHDRNMGGPFGGGI